MSRLIPNPTDIFRKVDKVIENVDVVLGRVDDSLGSVNVTLGDATTVLADVRDLLVDLRGELTLVGTLPAITAQLDEVHHLVTALAAHQGVHITPDRSAQTSKPPAKRKTSAANARTDQREARNGTGSRLVVSG